VAEPVTVVLVHRDQPVRCAATVSSFREQGVPVRFVIVDNGSEPEALGALRAAVPDAIFLEQGANTGFGPGANAGWRFWLDDPDGGEWAVVAPHDALPEPDCLRTLLDAAAERPRAGLASAEFGEPGRPVVDRYLGGVLGPSERRPGWERAGYPHGTLFIARRACLEEIGLFDERYFAYCEEADLGVRARRAGWEVGVVWGAVVDNPYVSNGAPAIDYLQLRNSLLLVREHFGRYAVTVRTLMAVYDTVLGLVWPRRRGMFFSLAARRRALADFLLGRYGAPPEHLLG
jgi:N-acetylglucosaminyl-diphospho-decaprenol L-rhamnosyltransferase